MAGVEAGGAGAGPFGPGMRVEFHGLQGAAALNGRTGHVLAFQDGRWGVEKDLSLPGEETHAVRVRPANLREAPALERTQAAVQALVDGAAAGCRVALPAGRFAAGPSERPLVIPKAISVVGQGEDTVLLFPVAVDEEASGKLLELARFSVEGAPVRVAGAALERVLLTELRVSLPMAGLEGGDALVLNPVSKESRRNREFLVQRCEVYGGSDGVCVDAWGVHFKECRIEGAASRGIFANCGFVIEDCVVTGCGGYGMKTRSGCERRGNNSIQPGPWDGHMQFGDINSMMGGMGLGGRGGYMGGMGGFMDAGGAAGWGDDGDDDGYNSDNEMGAYGFTRGEEQELLEQGVKPWDDDAHEVLAALRDW